MNLSSSSWSHATEKDHVNVGVPVLLYSLPPSMSHFQIDFNPAGPSVLKSAFVPMFCLRQKLRFEIRFRPTFPITHSEPIQSRF